MKVTCLTCGRQSDLEPGQKRLVVPSCGCDHLLPAVAETGTHPNASAAERSRSRAFAAAGVVKNVGGFALGAALISVIFFPVALVAIGAATYTLTALPRAQARYSGRGQAWIALFLGLVTFLGEGYLATQWLIERRARELQSLREEVESDLRTVIREQGLFRATSDAFGTFEELGFRPRQLRYVLSMGEGSVVGPDLDEVPVLPSGCPVPDVTESGFTVVAYANLDRDATFDIWVATDRGTPWHCVDDVTERTTPPPAATPQPTPADSPPEQGAEALVGTEAPPATLKEPQEP